MQSAREWAKSNHYDYRFYDDSLFDYAPDWFRKKADHHPCPVTDLARLVVARQLLTEGYDRTVWMDADMLIFDPKSMKLPIEKRDALLP